MPEFPLDPEILAREIDLPLQAWPLNCHGVASAVIERAPIPGMRLARGHYLGHVSRKSAYRGGPCQHSWLVLEDGRILDPTRWAMESPNIPSIYIGENDVYDEAGLEISARIMPRLPGMKLGFEPQLARAGRDKLARIAAALGCAAPEDCDPDGEQIARLADRIHWRLKSAPEQLDSPEVLYGALADAGLKALVKIDVWTRIMEPERVMARRGANRTFDAPAREDLSEAMQLTRIFCQFLRIEDRPAIETELEELGYSLEDLWDALNGLERAVIRGGARTIEDIPASRLDDLNVIAGDLLGSGHGQDIRVERFAASLGLDRNALDDLIRRAGKRSGYCTAWI